MRLQSMIVMLLVVGLLAVCSCNHGTTNADRSPTFAYAKETEGGCGDVFFHKGTADQREVMWISADKKKLKLPEEGSKTFDLAESPDGLQVAIDLWEAAPRFSAYCNDIGPDTKKQATWKAIDGRVTITVHAPPDGPSPGPKRYKAGVKLEGVVFENDKGKHVTLPEEAITEVEVGWYAG